MRLHVPGVILILFVVGGLALAADKEAAKDSAKDKVNDKAEETGNAKNKDPAKETGQGKDKAKDKDKDKDKDKPPACMHCGATCGLEAVCVCECGTKKKPKTEYEAKCEPICVPQLSRLPWPFSCLHGGTGCTDCGSDPRCGWVRQRKTLTKETKDEDVPAVERKVKYICCRCAGPARRNACGGELAAAVRRLIAQLRCPTGCEAR